MYVVCYHSIFFANKIALKRPMKLRLFIMFHKPWCSFKKAFAFPNVYNIVLVYALHMYVHTSLYSNERIYHIEGKTEKNTLTVLAPLGLSTVSERAIHSSAC